MQINKPLSIIFRAIKKYRKPVFVGFFLGISLFFGVLISGKSIGDKKEFMISLGKETANEINLLKKDIRQWIVSGLDPNESFPKGRNESQSKALEKSSEPEEKRFTVLFVGTDRRIGEKSLGNTDSLLIASVNTTNGKIALLSIPRDTQVMIPGYGMNKINAAARLGYGLQTTTTLIEKLIGQSIDGYVLTNFPGFKSIVDTLGGITLTVEKNMHYVTGDATDGIINLQKGTQRLNGTQALQYARFRNDAFADISRTSRQQSIFKAMEKEFMQVKTIPKLPWLIPELFKSVETDLSVNRIGSLADFLLRNKKLEVSSQTLPGAFVTENGISYWKVDSLNSRNVVSRLFKEGKTTSVFFR